MQSIKFSFSDDGYSPPAGNAIQFRIGATPRVCEFYLHPRGEVVFSFSRHLPENLEFHFVSRCWPPVVADGSHEEPPPEPGEESQVVPGTRVAWQRLQPVDRSLVVRWSRMAKRDREHRCRLEVLPERIDRTISVVWQGTSALATDVAVRWRDVDTIDCPVTRFYWYSPAPCARQYRFPWEKTVPVQREAVVGWVNRCHFFDYSLHSGWHQAIGTDNEVAVPWVNTLFDRDHIHRIYWGREVYKRVCTRDYMPPAGHELFFHYDTRLVHVGDGSHIDVHFTSLSHDLRCSQREPSGWRDPYVKIKTASWPITPHYLVLCVMNSASLIRVSDNQPIEVFSMGIRSDLDSWCWSFTARVSAASLPLVDPTTDPVEVLATINGYSWRFMVESWSERKRFGSNELTIAGRSPSAELAAPYAPLATAINVNQRTSVQLAEEQLHNTGWTIDFTAFDSWLVPPGALSYNNAPPLKVIQKVAEATGGRLQTHPKESRLIVRPRLHSLPWEWPAATPDLSISDYVVRQLGREFLPGVAYNAVFVGGETQGVLCKVYRSGTAGDQVAPMVTDALLTETAPCRARGKMVIGRSGKWSRESLELPLTAPGDLPGLLETGMLVSMNEGGENWRGQVVGVDVSASWQSGSGLSVSQSINVERYRGN